MRSRGPLRLVDNDEPRLEDESPGRAPQDKPFSIGVSLAVWAVMGGLAWAVIALLLHWL